MSEKWKEEVAHAKAVLVIGDRLRVRRPCGQVDVSVTFYGWDGNWICSKTLSDIAPSAVFKINGHPVEFRIPR